MADVLTLGDNSSLHIISYNCRGYNLTKRPYIQSLLPNTDILFLQEHWLSEDQLRLLGDIDSNFIYTGVSGFDCSDVLNGRPFGGCAIYGDRMCWRPSLHFIIVVDEYALFACVLTILSFYLSMSICLMKGTMTPRRTSSINYVS